jgi:hypothetical protein
MAVRIRSAGNAGSVGNADSADSAGNTGVSGEPGKADRMTRPDLSAVVRMTKEEGPWEFSPSFSLGGCVFGA